MLAALIVKLLPMKSKVPVMMLPTDSFKSILDGIIPVYRRY